jgi:hypothetical protein
LLYPTRPLSVRSEFHILLAPTHSHTLILHMLLAHKTDHDSKGQSEGWSRGYSMHQRGGGAGREGARQGERQAPEMELVLDLMIPHAHQVVDK